MMTSAGYLIDVKRGIPTVYRYTFDAYRHALNGYGTADAGYLVIECTFVKEVNKAIVVALEHSDLIERRRVNTDKTGPQNAETPLERICVLLEHVADRELVASELSRRL